ncbi:407_t:CDS:2, partial [Dentiscutata erythropus]
KLDTSKDSKTIPIVASFMDHNEPVLAKDQGEEEREPKVNRFFVQRISGNIAKLAEHSSQSVKKDHEKENQPPKSQKKTKPTDNLDLKSNNSIYNMLLKILDRLNKLENQKRLLARGTLAYCS